MTHIDLTDRVAIVTGSSRGIGQATVEKLLVAGANVIVNARVASEQAAEVFADFERRYPGRTTVVYGSVADPATPRAFGQAVTTKYKRLDILVNNAGILKDQLIGMISDDEIDELLDVHIKGNIRITQLAARLMTRRRSGTIVNLSSIIGRRGNVGQFVYSAAKAAILGATYTAAKELAPHNIRVNAVAPGVIDTDMTKRLPTDKKDDLLAKIGLKRMGTADDVANLILFLASDLSAYVTGQVIGVDGGLVI